jgi:hypothetical protein
MHTTAISTVSLSQPSGVWPWDDRDRKRRPVR